MDTRQDGTVHISQDAAIHHAQRGNEPTRVIRPIYALRWLTGPAPRHTTPEERQPPNTAYHVIDDGLILDVVRGSSEACMLGGLALKWRWPERMRTMGRPIDRPNLVPDTNTSCVGTIPPLLECRGAPDAS